MNPGNVMDYFSERSNPFYDRTCNNEIVKMQRLNPEQLNNMTGLEYILLHCQEPILYVIRKQHRHSPTQATPLTDYYIIAGIVYQAPDIGSIINSRILSAVHHIQTAFDKTQSYSRYHPSKGYWWDFKEQEGIDVKKPAKDNAKDEPSSLFQRQRVDVLLTELAKKYPPKVVLPSQQEKPPVPVEEPPKVIEIKQEIKQEKLDTTVNSNSSTTQPNAPKSAVKQPPEKRPRLA